MSRPTKELDGVTINGRVYHTGQLTEPERGSRVHLITLDPQVQSLCEATYGTAMRSVSDDVTCPRCKRVLLGRPVEKDDRVIPIDFDYQAWLAGGDKPKPKPKPKAKPKAKPEPQTDASDRMNWSDEDVHVEDLEPADGPHDWTNAEIDESKVKADVTPCSFTYPNGFRHTQPGPMATHIVKVRYMFGGRAGHLITYAVCDQCLRTLTPSQDQEAQRGRPEIVETKEITK